MMGYPVSGGAGHPGPFAGHLFHRQLPVSVHDLHSGDEGIFHEHAHFGAGDAAPGAGTGGGP